MSLNVNIPGGTAIATLGTGASSFDIPISEGPGTYFIRLTAACTGSVVTVALRLNGAPLTTPRNIDASQIDTGAQAPDSDTAGNVMWTRASYTPTTLLFWGTIEVRPSAVCAWDIAGFGTDGTRKQWTQSVGKHNPTLPPSSFGFITEGTLTAGAELRAKKISD